MGPRNLVIPSEYGLEHHGLSDLNREYWNLGPSALVEQIVPPG